MKDGFIRAAAATPNIRVADCAYNINEIMECVKKACKKHTKLIVFPELCVTGYTCGDLFLQESLLAGAMEGLARLLKFSKDKDIVICIGLPMTVDQKLYNVGAVVQRGRILGLVPKMNIPNYSEFYEARHFNPGIKEPKQICVLGQETWFGSRVLFSCKNMSNFVLALEICEDLWVPAPPSIGHALAGATVIGNLSASDEITGKDTYRENLVGGQSARLVCGYIYADAGEGESTTDLVFGGHNVIAENGNLLSGAKRFENQIIFADLDMEKLAAERRRMTTFAPCGNGGYVTVSFELDTVEFKLDRRIDPSPFVPSDILARGKRCEEILNIQALGLKKRLIHTHSEHAVVGISGGLDSTLALLVMIRAFDMLGLDRKKAIAVTMPCFGTTDRTYNNACRLVNTLGATLREVDIKAAVRTHFSDIGHSEENHDVTYENSQARERTQVLMDIANQCNGLVVGTGDMSELALGWATYNGDHMSMYGVNSSVPKTLVRHLVRFYADTSEDETLKETLLDVLDTPVSPELIPPKDGEISQKTEDLVGPYELHDFYLYYAMRFGFRPSKIYRMACIAFENVYDKETILKWLKKFYWRFFSQQFKRSCLPDGPKVGSVALSPRGDWRMPSDACVALWQNDLERIRL